jgi:hypothetical protein
MANNRFFVGVRIISSLLVCPERLWDSPSLFDCRLQEDLSCG